jgi:hypothetical protein
VSTHGIHSKESRQDSDEILASTKVVNFISVGVLFFQLKWSVSVSEYFGVLFRGCTVNIYVYMYMYIYNSINIIQIQDKLIINYAIQTQCETNIKYYESKMF